MTTRYHLPDGVLSVSANGREYTADADGTIDLGYASAESIALLVQHAGIKPVRSQEDLDREAADAAEAIRFEAALKAALAGHAATASAVEQGDQGQAEAEAAAIAAAREQEAAEAAVRAAAVAAAPIVTEAEGADEEAFLADAAATRAVIPPKRKK